jgi:two-component system phosphate regulon sensor histidine kinase PhoR
VETLLETGNRDRDESRRFLEIVNRNADRLAAIIEDLLALARLEEPGADRDLERAETPLAPLMESVAAQYRQAAADKDMTLFLEVPPDLEVSVNARLFEQAISNLLSNAVKFAPTGTTVTLTGPGPEPRAGGHGPGPGDRQAHRAGSRRPGGGRECGWHGQRLSHRASGRYRPRSEA